MRSYKGKSVYKGIALGPVAVLANKETQVKRRRIDDPELEIARLEEAAGRARKQLQTLYDKALREVGEANAAIFEVHQMMLEDEGYLGSYQI